MRPITVARQLSEGGVPSIDDNRECESAHDVSNLVDAPSAGNASIEAFFTRKGDTVYAILRRWLGMSFARRNAAGLSPSTVSPFGTSGAFRFTGSGTTITVAPPRS